jgi:hypothetical protein
MPILARVGPRSEIDFLTLPFATQVAMTDSDFHVAVNESTVWERVSR